MARRRVNTCKSWSYNFTCEVHSTSGGTSGVGEAHATRGSFCAGAPSKAGRPVRGVPACAERHRPRVENQALHLCHPSSHLLARHIREELECHDCYDQGQADLSLGALPAAMAPALCPRLAYARPVGLDQHRGRIGDDVRESALPLRFWE